MANIGNSLKKKLYLYLRIGNYKEVSGLLKNEQQAVKMVNKFVSLGQNIVLDGVKVSSKSGKGIILFIFTTIFADKHLYLNALDFVVRFSQKLMDINVDFYKLKGKYIKFYMNLTSDNKTDAIEKIKDLAQLNVVEDKTSAYSQIKILLDKKIYIDIIDKYKVTSYENILIKNKRCSFYLLIIKHLLNLKLSKVKDVEKVSDDFIKIPQKIQKNSEFNENIINNQVKIFETKASFFRLGSVKICDFIENKIKETNSGNIFILKYPNHLGSIDNIFFDELSKKNIIKVQCYKNNPRFPFYTIREIIKTYYKLTEIEAFSMPQKLEGIEEHIKSILNLMPYENDNFDKNYETLLSKIIDFFVQINNNYMIMIDDFNFVDEGSLKIFKKLFEVKAKYNFNILFSINNGCKFFNILPSLLNKENVFHFDLVSDDFDDLAKEFLLNDIEGIQYYLPKLKNEIQKSKFYMKNLMQYFRETNVLTFMEGKWFFDESNFVKIPSSINNLLFTKILYLAKMNEFFEVWVFLLFAQFGIRKAYLRGFGVKEERFLMLLEDRDFITIRDDIVYVANQKYYQKLIKHIQNEYPEIINRKKQIEKFKMYLPPFHPIMFDKGDDFYYNGLEHVSTVGLSFGDYSIFARLQKEFMFGLEEQNISENDAAINNIMLSLISTCFIKNPELIVDVLEQAINRFKNSDNVDLVRTLYYFAYNTCYSLKNYYDSYVYLNEVLARMVNKDYNMSSINFNPNMFLLVLKKVEILFELGQIEASSKIFEDVIINLNVDNQEKAYDAFGGRKNYHRILNICIIYYLLESILSLKDDLNEKINKVKAFYSGNTDEFNLLYLIENLFMTGTLNNDFAKIASNIKTPIGKILTNLYRIVLDYSTSNSINNSQIINETKELARQIDSISLNYILDLVAAMLHSNAGNHNITDNILMDVIDKSNQFGLLNINLLAFYLSALNKVNNNKLEEAKSLILEIFPDIEKVDDTLIILTINFKILLSRIYIINPQTKEKGMYILNQVIAKVKSRNITAFDKQINNIINQANL